MTHQQITWAIDEAAKLAAQSAVDAFGSEAPNADVAWDFLNDQIYCESERPAGLPEFLPNQFRCDYRRHVRNILAGNPFYESQ